MISVLPGAIRTNFESRFRSNADNHLGRPNLDTDVVSVYKHACNKYEKGEFYSMF